MKLTRQQLLLAVVGLVLGGASAVLIIRHQAPTAPVREEVGPPLYPAPSAQGGVPAAAPAGKAEAEAKGTVPGLPASGRSAKAERGEPLPALIPGGPLTDERFAAISARIVIAAIGLQKGKDWEVNTMAYMAQVFDQEKITEKDYRDYAEALNKQPDRARAVAESIMDKAEKKLGYRVTMKTLPVFKVDEQAVKDLERKVDAKVNRRK